MELLVCYLVHAAKQVNIDAGIKWNMHWLLRKHAYDRILF